MCITFKTAWLHFLVLMILHSFITTSNAAFAQNPVDLIQVRDRIYGHSLASQPRQEAKHEKTSQERQTLIEHMNKAVFEKFGSGTNYQNRRRVVNDRVTHSTQVLGEASRTIFLILVLSAFEITKQEIEKTKLTGQKPNLNEIMEISGDAVSLILDSGEIWAGISGALASTVALSTPLSILDEIIESNISKKALATLMKIGVSTLVTFLGWELGSQLWREARQLLESNDDYQRADRIWSLGFKYILSTLSNNSNNPDKLLVQKMLRNIFKIVFTNDEFRNQWLYNTWRHKIATGDFVTLVSAMVGASWSGSQIYPGAGTITGLMFGLVGGVIYLSVPLKYKSKIDSGIFSIRRFKAQRDLQGHYSRIQSIILKYKNPHLCHRKDQFTENTILSMNLMLGQVHAIRDLALDVSIEKAHEAVVNRNKNLVRLDLANEFKNLSKEEIVAIEKAIVESNIDIQTSLQEIIKGVENERDLIDTILANIAFTENFIKKNVTNFSHHSNYCLFDPPSSDFIRMLDIYYDRIVYLMSVTESIKHALKDTSSENYSVAAQILDQFYYFGIDTRTLIHDSL